MLPILTAKCSRCHGDKVHKSELSLITPAGILRGGSSGEVVVPGKADESLLFEMAHADAMPPEGESPRLTEEEVATIRSWIDAGAPFKQPLFETAAAPILQARCIECHSASEPEGGLDLSTAVGLARGGDSGAAVEAGNTERSLLYQRIHDGSMPPEDAAEPLSEHEKASIREWIAAGARHAVDPAAAAQPQLTEHEIAPIMLLRCTVCHGLRRQEGGLDLRTRESMLTGGKSGPAITLGDAENSLLLKRVRAGEMPPTRRVVEVSVKPMTAPEIDRLAAWINSGAPQGVQRPDVASADGDPLVTDEDRQFWSFQPPRTVTPPAVEHERLVRNEIDRFVLARLEQEGLALSPEADRRTLARRLYFDLLGLPPTPAQIDAFVADASPNAYETLVEDLLASPHYGERWGRYWLDAAGYSDSEGKTNQDVIRKWMWRYRDYVIAAFNADKPYDRFLLEQIAGDELADYENAAEITPEIHDNLVATGFLRCAADGTWANITNFVPDRLDVVADEIQVLGSAVLGMTLNCCRCHTHKFDPLPQRDYYRLAAIFKPAFDEHDWLGPDKRYLSAVATSERRAYEEHNGRIDAQIAELRQEVADQASAVADRYFDAHLADAPEVLREDLRNARTTAPESRGEVAKYLLEKFAAIASPADKTLREFDAEYAARAGETDKRIKRLNDQRLPEPQIRALWDRGSPSPTYILRRGDYQQSDRLVGPGVPSVLTDGKSPFEVQPPWPRAKSTGRRLAFARWLTRPEHPLTARVMVNRIWHHHFGRGMVETLGNFGKTGAAPSHPEMLDWLAQEFVARGWSVKEMHRLMVNSAVYRQTSAIGERQQQLDPDNKLLSRMPLRRLEAEAVYDSILAVSGALDATPFGPPDDVDVRGDGLVTIKPTSRGYRRSVYALQRRTQIPSILDSFDFPQMSPNCLERGWSTVAPQALHLLNDAQVHGLSKQFAERVVAEAGHDATAQVAWAFRLAFGREPTAAEHDLATRARTQLVDLWSDAPGQKTLELQSVAELWIRESHPETVWENDLVSVWSGASTDGARRYGLIEFDLAPLSGATIHGAQLELGAGNGAVVRQTAALIPPGIEGLTWSKFQIEKSDASSPLESLGACDGERAGNAQGRSSTLPASPADVARLQACIRQGRVAFVLMPVEDGIAYQRDWDDGSLGTRPRLVVEHGALEPEEANLRALVNLCHALINSAEFVYVD